MTTQSNQERARRRLGQYKRALDDLDYLADSIETLAARATSVSVPPDANAGWTGQYLGRSKYGKGWMVTDDPDELVNPRKVRAIPNVDPGTRDPKAGETILIALIDEQLKLDRLTLDAEKLRRTLEREIDERCTDTQAKALKYRYILCLPHTKARRKMHYSETQWFRIINEALDVFGEKMEKTGVNGSKWE